MGGRGVLSYSRKGNADADRATAKGSSSGSTSQPMTPEQALAATNPNYSTGYEYRVNCQRCVYAYEMNRRGELCEAKPRIMNGDSPSRDDEVAQNWRNIMQGQTWDKVGSRGKKRTISNLDGKMAEYGEGSRAIVYVTWKGGRSSHVFNAERIGGETKYFDAQTGKAVDISSYIGSSMPTRTMVSRIDNLVPDSRYIDGCITRR